MRLVCSRSPHGERGLKSLASLAFPSSSLSLPSRGAWIEIAALISVPHLLHMSLPSRGAWIEIGKTKAAATTSGSLPSRGAWIEIFEIIKKPLDSNCRSPHGERGLKFLVNILDLYDKATGRSPHGERGLKYFCGWGSRVSGGRSPHGERGLKSLSPEADLLVYQVAPLTGSVD